MEIEIYEKAKLLRDKGIDIDIHTGYSIGVTNPERYYTVTIKKYTVAFVKLKYIYKTYEEALYAGIVESNKILAEINEE